MANKEEELRKTLHYLIEDGIQASDERTALCMDLLNKKTIDTIAIKETLDKIKTSSPSSRVKLIGFQVILERYLTESEGENSNAENKVPQSTANTGFESVDPTNIAARLSKTKDVCRKCGTTFSWTEGYLHASELEIKGTVVACPKCHSVYIVNIVSGNMSLGNDVTDQYPQIKQNKAVTPNQSAIKKDEKRGRNTAMILGVIFSIILICCLGLIFFYIILQNMSQQSMHWMGEYSMVFQTFGALNNTSI